jgi:hypothetical protein
LSDTTYLWSDDNLSTDYLFTKIQDDDLRLIANYRNYGRVCCIKGFDAASFAFNTTADPAGYDRQFEILRRYMNIGIDIYGYVTLTGNDLSSIHAGVTDLFDRLRSIHEALPLRVVPLKIGNYTPTTIRSKGSDRQYTLADVVQSTAIECWNLQLQQRYSPAERALNIVDVKL